MPKLYMIRHGEAAAGWGHDPDPGLSDNGAQQAESVAAHMARYYSPMAIKASPMRRCQETARPLTGLWDVKQDCDPRISEISSPTDDLEERTAWLRQLMMSTWETGGPTVTGWRQSVIHALLECKEDTVLFSHFVAINAAAGAALGENRVLMFQPDNCSVTVFSNDGGKLSLLEKGREAETLVG